MEGRLFKEHSDAPGKGEKRKGTRLSKLYLYCLHPVIAVALDMLFGVEHDKLDCLNFRILWLHLFRHGFAHPCGCRQPARAAGGGSTRARRTFKTVPGGRSSRAMRVRERERARGLRRAGGRSVLCPLLRSLVMLIFLIQCAQWGRREGGREQGRDHKLKC